MSINISQNLPTTVSKSACISCGSFSVDTQRPLSYTLSGQKRVPRKGPTGKVLIRFNGSGTRFSNLAREDKLLESH